MCHHLKPSGTFPAPLGLSECDKAQELSPYSTFSRKAGHMVFGESSGLDSVYDYFLLFLCFLNGLSYMMVIIGSAYTTYCVYGDDLSGTVRCPYCEWGRGKWRVYLKHLTWSMVTWEGASRVATLPSLTHQAHLFTGKYQRH